MYKFLQGLMKPLDALLSKITLRRSRARNAGGDHAVAQVAQDVVEILECLPPQERETILAILANARDEESLNCEVQRHPDLPKALQAAVPSDSHNDGPDELTSILQELGQPARSLKEMPRRIQLCHRALAVVQIEEDAELWAILNCELATSLAQNPNGSLEDNLEEAIAHAQQALTVYSREASPPEWAEAQLILAATYCRRIRGERAENLDKAIAHAQQTLTVYTREADPERWSMTQYNLAAAYCDRIGGERAANLEKAIAYAQQALTVYTCDANPHLWAGTHYNLAKVYRNRIQGERAANLEEAITHAQQALIVYTREAFPVDWAATQQGLVSAYGDRIQGERAANLEEAIAHAQQALTVYTREAFPVDWAGTQHNLANVYRDRIQGQRAANLEKAIAHAQQALTVYTRGANPEHWALTQHSLAAAYHERIRGERAENLEQAIEHYEQALVVRTHEASPIDWARTEYNLANVYRDRIRGERAENLEAAIAHAQQALTVRTCETFPADWALTHYSLAATYHERIRGERAENLEAAIAHAQQALTVYTREAYPERWAMTQHILTAAYCDRIQGERAANLEAAIAHAQQALTVYTREAYPERWAMTQHNLAAAYCHRVRGQRAANLEEAIAYAQRALTMYTRASDPEHWAMIQHTLANAYKSRIQGERAENLEEAIALYQHALLVWTREANPERWAQTQNNLANAYRVRIRGERTANREQAILHCHQALLVRTLGHFPADFQTTQFHLGDLYFSGGAWAEALTAYQEAIRAEHVLLNAAYTEVGRQSEVSKTAELYARTAYALLKVGCWGEALMQLDQGKTRLMSKSMALNDVNLSALTDIEQKMLRNLRQTIRFLETEMRLPADTPARRDDRELAKALDQVRIELNDTIALIRRTHSDFMPEGLSLPEILALIPPHAALVAPIFTLQGSAVFLVPAGQHSVSMEHVLWLDQFKDTDLDALLKGPALDSSEEPRIGGWLGPYLNAEHNAGVWRDTISATSQALWAKLVEPIAERLTTLKVRQVLLMPQGGLGLLPLHAAWHEVDGTRRYFLDDYSVTYLPSAYAHKVSLERMNDTQRHGRSLLAIINPTNDLKYATAEGEQVAGLFEKDKTTVLPNTDSDATVKTVTEQRSVGYVHFSCHGFYRWNDPMQSGLVLANREPLTLAQIIGHFSLDSTRLVTLSACETGITDIRKAPDEYLGLPAGFLQAGAQAVVSTLWAVNDLSTMLLMERFYQLHLKEGQDLPVALRHAQIWLREVTAGELAQRFADEEEALLSTTRMSINTASDYFTRFTKLNPNEKPFAHPYYWAPFTFSGA